MIVTFATENYKDYLILLLDSYLHFNPKRKATIYLLGWSNIQRDIIKQKYQNFVFKDVKIKNDFLDKVAKNKRIGEILKNKPEYLLQTYKEHKGPVLWVDADSIVLDSIKPLLNKLNSSEVDLMCTHRPEHKKDHAKFAVAVLGFGNHRMGMEFLKKYVSAAKNCQGVNNWFQEQLALYEAYKEYRPRLYSLSENEHSIRRNKNTIIFSRRVNFEYDKMKKLLEDRGVYEKKYL